MGAVSVQCVLNTLEIELYIRLNLKSSKMQVVNCICIFIEKDRIQIFFLSLSALRKVDFCDWFYAKDLQKKTRFQAFPWARILKSTSCKNKCWNLSKYKSIKVTTVWVGVLYKALYEKQLERYRVFLENGLSMFRSKKKDTILNSECKGIRFLPQT